MISDQQHFFSSNLVGRIFSPLNALQDIFLSPHLSAGLFFPKKNGFVSTFTECSYIYIVVIAVIVLIWNCKKTDDVFSLWDVNRKDIDLFIEQANTFHPPIKFTAKISEKEHTFLDMVVYKGERFLKEAILPRSKLTTSRPRPFNILNTRADLGFDEGGFG